MALGGRGTDWGRGRVRVGAGGEVQDAGPEGAGKRSGGRLGAGRGREGVQPADPPPTAERRCAQPSRVSGGSRAAPRPGAAAPQRRALGEEREGPLPSSRAEARTQAPRVTPPRGPALTTAVGTALPPARSRDPPGQSECPSTPRVIGGRRSTWSHPANQRAARCEPCAGFREVRPPLSVSSHRTFPRVARLD